jgi:hypothetical protein
LAEPVEIRSAGYLLRATLTDTNIVDAGLYPSFEILFPGCDVISRVQLTCPFDPPRVR